MKILIIRETYKHGERYFAYRSGLLSRLGIFCIWNRVTLSGSDTPDGCIKNAKYELKPDPPRNPKTIDTVEI